MSAYSLCISVSAFSVLQMYDNKKYPPRKKQRRGMKPRLVGMKLELSLSINYISIILDNYRPVPKYIYSIFGTFSRKNMPIY